MQSFYFATTESSGGILGFSLQAFVIQLITFLLVFALLKKFAFAKIVAMLDKRHQTISAGVRHGLEMEKEKKQFLEETEKVAREARHEADQIIADAEKEAREIIRESEKSAHKKSEIMLKDAEERIHEEAEQAKIRLEKEIAGYVAEATEAVVGKKIDKNLDSDIIKKAVNQVTKKA